MAAKVKELAERVTADYLGCLDALGVDGIDHMPRATEHIDGIIAITKGLIDKGFAYPSGGDVYFDVTKAPDYGKLSHRDPEELQAGARIEPSAVKRHPGDFALWKGSKPGEPAWESPWGPGRPGWHIECSAMSMKLLGDHFDIHGGGLDLVFPHHENEVVQSESYTGKPFATYWLHNGLLTKAGKKISKSRPRHGRPDERPARAARPRHPPRAVLIEPLPPADRLRDRRGSRSSRKGLQAFHKLFERFERITGTSYFALEAPKTRAEGDAHAALASEEIAAHPRPVPRRDGRRLQHRRRPRRPLRAGPLALTASPTPLGLRRAAMARTSRGSARGWSSSRSWRASWDSSAIPWKRRPARTG